jgi:hypothetical protein
MATPASRTLILFPPDPLYANVAGRITEKLLDVTLDDFRAALNRNQYIVTH